MKEIDIYAPADKAIKSMNRDMLRDFGTLKMSKFDEIRIIRNVTEVYRKQAQKARKRYYEVGFEAYLLALFLCGIGGKKAYGMADRAITGAWVDEQLSEISLVTGYRFDTETERKAQRLTETLAAAVEVQRGGGNAVSGGTGLGADAEIDRAVRAWSKQVGQFALDISDAAVMEAYENAGIAEGQWATEKDEKVCTTCHALDGRIFPLEEIPAKPHWGCRCKVLPVRRNVV